MPDERPATSATRVALVAGWWRTGGPTPPDKRPATSATRVALVAGREGRPRQARLLHSLPAGGGRAAHDERDSSCTRCRLWREEQPRRARLELHSSLAVEEVLMDETARSATRVALVAGWWREGSPRRA